MAIPYKVGLTGGIGSGKSTVAELFKALGVKVIDADKFSHELTRPGEPALAEIVKLFGSNVLDQSGALKRDILRKKVFKNKTSLLKLEKLMHPLVFKKIKESVRQIDTGYCILSIPMLIETGSENIVDTILVMDCPEDTQVERILDRKGITREIARYIIANQVSRTERLKKADEIIDNSGDINNLERQVRHLHDEYTNRALKKLK